MHKSVDMHIYIYIYMCVCACITRKLLCFQLGLRRLPRVTSGTGSGQRIRRVRPSCGPFGAVGWEVVSRA